MKPTKGEANPENIILHVGTNNLNSEKTSNQIARSITDLAISLNVNTNAITNSLITLRNNGQNNKAGQVNNCLVNMCGERNISVIGHSDTIPPDTNLNKSGLHSNKFETTAFAEILLGIY